MLKMIVTLIIVTVMYTFFYIVYKNYSFEITVLSALATIIGFMYYFNSTI